MGLARARTPGFFRVPPREPVPNGGRSDRFSGMLATFSFPTTIVFGPRAIQELPARLRALGISKPLIVTDRGLLETPAFHSVRTAAGGALPVFADVRPNPTG